MPTPDEVEKQRQVDHDTLIRVEEKIGSLTKTVEQNTLTMSSVVQGATTDISVLKLEVDRLKTGLNLTRWFFAVLGGVLTLATMIYDSFRH